MPDIRKSVGHGGTNDAHDVALVQAMLRVVKTAKNTPYLAGHYDGIYGNQTKQAIIAFQKDHATLAAGVKDVVKEKLGLVLPVGHSVKKMSALLPQAYKTMRVIENTKTVYLEGDAADELKSRQAIIGDAEFQPAFRQRVGDLVQQMFATHKIVLWLTPTGRRRTFAQQARETKTNAGPGESNHNFGRAVDIGFRGFKWVRANGTIKKDADWLNALETVKAAQAGKFWDARDFIAIKKLGLFRLQFERVHLQAFDQSTVSNVSSLVSLLNTVGTMNWKGRYWCDMGTGKKMWATVGSAKQIWAGAATLSKAELAQARSLITGKAVKASTITAKDLTAARAALKADFEAADMNWAKWAPVP